jgi:hypothetical protein
MRAALIDLVSGLVVNVVVADASDHAAPDGFLLVNSDTANIGDTWDGTQIVITPHPNAVDPMTANPGISAL